MAAPKTPANPRRQKATMRLLLRLLLFPVSWVSDVLNRRIRFETLGSLGFLFMILLCHFGFTFFTAEFYAVAEFVDGSA
jgi:hypothetical protein